MNDCRNYTKGERLESASDKTVRNINSANVKRITGAVELAVREKARRAVEIIKL
jgi:hypothetical protein